VLLASSSLEDANDLVSAAREDVVVLQYSPKTTDPAELAGMVGAALNGRKASSIAFAAHDCVFR
jgi:hypothetical protein